jgi:hypothetical protein
MGIELAPDGRVLVPLDYWTELVGYVASVGTVRESLERQGLLVGQARKADSVIVVGK